MSVADLAHSSLVSGKNDEVLLRVMEIQHSFETGCGARANVQGLRGWKSPYFCCITRVSEEDGKET